MTPEEARFLGLVDLAALSRALRYEIAQQTPLFKQYTKNAWLRAPDTVQVVLLFRVLRGLPIKEEKC